MNKIVIYFSGGTMSGIFGAGVATAFQDSDIYPRVSAIYGASAGVAIGAYFLARQTRLGSSIYLEDCTKNFISVKNFLIGTWQRFQNKFIKPIPSARLKDAIDIEYIMDIVRTRKWLDTGFIISQDIPLYAKLLDLDTGDIVYIDMRHSNILDIFMMAISPFPYVHKVVKIDHRRYIDAGIVDILGLDIILRKHPNDKILVILNRPSHTKLSCKIKNMLEGKFMQWMFDDRRLYTLHISAEKKFKQDLENIMKNPRVTVVALPETALVNSRTTSSKNLLEAYELGIQTGTRVLKNLNLATTIEDPASMVSN